LKLLVEPSSSDIEAHELVSAPPASLIQFDAMASVNHPTVSDSMKVETDLAGFLVNTRMLEDSWRGKRVMTELEEGSAYMTVRRTRTRSDMIDSPKGVHVHNPTPLLSFDNPAAASLLVPHTDPHPCFSL
jgi:hypothetical protein